MSHDAEVHHVISRLRDIWLETTPETISHDIELARSLVREVPTRDRERAIQYLEAIRRLEPWLRDR